MFNEVIKLVGTTKTVDAFGDTVEVETEREVFASVRSVFAKRRMEALAVGLKVEWKFVLADYYDYRDEEKIKYDGKTWNVISNDRTKENGIELTVTRC